MTIETLVATDELKGCEITYNPTTSEGSVVLPGAWIPLATITSDRITVDGMVITERMIEAAAVVLGREPIGDRPWLMLMGELSVQIEDGPIVKCVGQRVQLGSIGWTGAGSIAAAAALLTLQRAGRPTQGVSTVEPVDVSMPADVRLYAEAMRLCGSAERHPSAKESRELLRCAVSMLAESHNLCPNPSERAARLLAAVPIEIDLGEYTAALRLVSLGLDGSVEHRGRFIEWAEQIVGLLRGDL